MRIAAGGSEFSPKDLMVQAEAGVAYFGRQFIKIGVVTDVYGYDSLGLEDAMGAGYLGEVFGKTRLGTSSRPLGTRVTDFTDGILTARYRLTPSGDWKLTTIYASPK